MTIYYSSVQQAWMHKVNVPIKRMISYTFVQSQYSRSGSGSNILKLECGHTIRRKSSLFVPDRCYCIDCCNEAETKQRKLL